MKSPVVSPRHAGPLAQPCPSHLLRRPLRAARGQPLRRVWHRQRRRRPHLRGPHLPGPGALDPGGRRARAAAGLAGHRLLGARGRRARRRFWLYYSVGFEDRGHHLRVAVSRSPTGPFIDQGVNLSPTERFAIDASPFRDDDGTWYLFHARDVLEGDRVGTMGRGCSGRPTRRRSCPGGNRRPPRPRATVPARDDAREPGLADTGGWGDAGAGPGRRDRRVPGPAPPG